MKKRQIIEIMILLAFFLTCSFLVLGLNGFQNSPDEQANYIFTKNFANNFSLSVKDDLNLDLFGLVHPRSTVVIGNAILPGSFIGLPVFYGLIGRALGDSSILFITPFFAVLAVLAWRETIKKFFKDQKLADISAIALMIHPAFWYYGGRVMMHNIAFISFLIFSVWFLVPNVERWGKASPNAQRWVECLFAGVMVGFALAFRSSEVVWVGGLVVIGSYYLYQRSKSIKKPLIFLATIAVVLLPFLAINNHYYGGYLESGYTVETPIPTQTSTSASIQNINEPLPGVLGLFFPFGIHELAIVRNVYKYCFQIYPWMSLLAVAGLAIVVVKHRKEKNWQALLIMLGALSVWLGVVYGSWTFTDNPDPRVVSLGNSHVRYWLPLFILSSPLIAKAILELSLKLKNKIKPKITITTITVILIALSAHLVFFGQDGFVATRSALGEFEQKRSKVLEKTEADSIIIVDMADKYLWPERSVVEPLRSEVTYQMIPILIESAPLYYFGLTLPLEDLNYLNNEKLAEDRVVITPILQVSNETLYNIKHAD